MSSVVYEAVPSATEASAASATAGSRSRGRDWRRWALLGALAAYLVGLHAALAAAFLQDDFALRVQRKVGLTPHKQEFDRGYRWWASALARSDARARPGAVLFLGDSIMRDLDTSSIARHTINMAIPGDTTARLLRRMAGYRSVLTARGVVIGIGNNDLDWRPVPEALDNYRRIVGLVPPATPVLLVAVLPLDEKVARAGVNAGVRALNEGIAAVCAARPGCRFVDPTPRLADGSGNLSALAHEGDGEHLSAVGHEIYWKAINAAVVSFLPPAAVTPPAQ